MVNVKKLSEMRSAILMKGIAAHTNSREVDYLGMVNVMVDRPISVKGCGYDNGDCQHFVRDFPDCPLNELANKIGSDKVILGNGICDSDMYNIESCGYDYGDCRPGQLGEIMFGGVVSYTKASL